jgi:hypothetical protein
VSEGDSKDEEPADEASDEPRAAAASRDDAGPPEHGLATAVRAVAISGAVMAVGAAIGVDLPTAASVFVGGALATANLALFVKLGQAFLDQRGQSAPWIALGGIKMLALFACVFILLRRGDVSALGLACGYGALPIGITVSTLFRRPAPLRKAGPG